MLIQDVTNRTELIFQNSKEKTCLSKLVIHI